MLSWVLARMGEGNMYFVEGELFGLSENTSESVGGQSRLTKNGPWDSGLGCEIDATGTISRL